MLAVFLLVVAGVVVVLLLLAMFAALCLAIRSEDRTRLGSGAPGQWTTLARLVLGLTVRRPDLPQSSDDAGHCLVSHGSSSRQRRDLEGM
jgi:hypothetical protein